MCDKDATSPQPGNSIQRSERFHLIQGVCESAHSSTPAAAASPLSFLVRACRMWGKVARMMAARDGGGGKVTGFGGGKSGGGGGGRRGLPKPW